METTDGPAPKLAPGHHVKLSFADQGPGISAAILPRIFDPFFTTKPGGSGVGLTATYAILKKHDGHVDVESQPNQGTTFHVWIPAARDKAARARPARGAVTPGQGLVLVMDDDDMVRQVAGGMLTHLGYEPITTCEGAEAVARTRELPADGKHLSALLLDLTVRSGEGGRETVGPLRALLPGVRIVASSGYSDDPIMAAPTQYGFSASLRKPFTLNQLGELLAQLLRPPELKD